MIDKNDIDAVLDEAQMGVDDRNEQDLPEAPASVTIRAWIRGYGVMITARDTKVASLLKKTETMIDYAESHKWQPTWDKTPVGQPASPQAASGPRCIKHDKMMVQGKFGWYCQSKDDSEPKGWCRSKPPVEWAREA